MIIGISWKIQNLYLDFIPLTLFKCHPNEQIKNWKNLITFLSLTLEMWSIFCKILDRLTNIDLKNCWFSRNHNATKILYVHTAIFQLWHAKYKSTELLFKSFIKINTASSLHTKIYTRTRTNLVMNLTRWSKRNKHVNDKLRVVKTKFQTWWATIGNTNFIQIKIICDIHVNRMSCFSKWPFYNLKSLLKPGISLVKGTSKSAKQKRIVEN